MNASNVTRKVMKWIEIGPPSWDSRLIRAYQRLRQKTFRRFLTQDLFKILIDLWHPTIIETIQLFRLRQV